MRMNESTNGFLCDTQAHKFKKQNYAHTQDEESLISVVAVIFVLHEMSIELLLTWKDKGVCYLMLVNS